MIGCLCVRVYLFACFCAFVYLVGCVSTRLVDCLFVCLID